MASIYIYSKYYKCYVKPPTVQGLQDKSEQNQATIALRFYLHYNVVQNEHIALKIRRHDFLSLEVYKWVYQIRWNYAQRGQVCF